MNYGRKAYSLFSAVGGHASDLPDYRKVDCRQAGPMSKIIHLLKPKEFRVWCRPNNVPGNFFYTIMPSKADCANCLTAFRTATTGRKTPFRVAHTNRGPREIH